MDGASHPHITNENCLLPISEKIPFIEQACARCGKFDGNNSENITEELRYEICR